MKKKTKSSQTSFNEMFFCTPRMQFWKHCWKILREAKLFTECPQKEQKNVFSSLRTLFKLFAQDPKMRTKHKLSEKTSSQISSLNSAGWILNNSAEKCSRELKNFSSVSGKKTKHFTWRLSYGHVDCSHHNNGGCYSRKIWLQVRRRVIVKILR